MTEIVAAHLERVAKELIFAWQVRSNLRAPGDTSTEPYEDWIIADVAAALAACARESEKPWREGIAAIIAKFTEFRDDNKERYEKHSWNQAFQAMAVYDEALKDLRALERAVGEKGQA